MFKSVVCVTGALLTFGLAGAVGIANADTASQSARVSTASVASNKLATSISALSSATQDSAAVAVSLDSVEKPALSPHFSSIELVSVIGGRSDYQSIADVIDGATLTLGEHGSSLLNVLVNPRTYKGLASVVFELDGPVSIRRVENAAHFTLFDDKTHLKASDSKTLPDGDYQLRVTPYSQLQGKGTAGESVVLNFTVRRDVDKPAPAPVEQTKSFTVVSDSSNPEYQFTVSSGTGSDYELLQYPDGGEMVMDPAGNVVYVPYDNFAGVDHFTYSANTEAGKVVTSASVTVLNTAASTTSGAGFTVFAPSSASKIWYVSSSSGSDSNDCASAAKPCKTLAAGIKKLRSGYPDHLYLKRGDTWTGETISNLPSGRSIKEPLVVSYYGDKGARPILQHDKAVLHFMNNVRRYISFVGLHFKAHRHDPLNKSFTGNLEHRSNVSLIGQFEHIWFEDNKFDHSELIVQEFGGKNPSDITVRRNIFTGSFYNQSSLNRNNRPSNIYADGVDGLVIEENVFDHGGWHPTVKNAGGNMFNHNLYIQYKTNGARMVLRNNIITRGASHGAQLRAGGLAEDNFFGRNSIGLLIGYSEEPLKDGVRAYALRNVVTEGESMAKGDNACAGTNLCTSAVWGIQMKVNGKADYRAEGNIVHSLSNSTSWKKMYKSLVLRPLYGFDDAAVKGSNNVSYAWTTNADKGVPSGVTLRTLGDYYAKLRADGAIPAANGTDNFDRFMNVVLNRNLGEWDTRLTAKAVNEYIRAGIK